MDNQNVLQMGLVQHNSVGRQNPPSSYYMLVEEHHLNAGKAEPRMNRFLKTYRNDVSLGQKSWSLLYSRIHCKQRGKVSFEKLQTVQVPGFNSHCGVSASSLRHKVKQVCLDGSRCGSHDGPRVVISVSDSRTNWCLSLHKLFGLLQRCLDGSLQGCFLLLINDNKEF